MRSIKSRFIRVQCKQPFTGSCIVLAVAVKGQKFAKSAIARQFSKLVPNDEYEKRDRRKIVEHLTRLSNISVDDEIMIKNV